MLEELGFKAVLKEKKVTLNEEEAAMLGNGFFAGHQMNSSSYYTWIKQARAKAYVDSGRSGLTGDDSYVSWWHWRTRAGDHLSGCRDKERTAGCTGASDPPGDKNRQNIATTPEGTYAHNTYAESGHTDPFTEKREETKMSLQHCQISALSSI